MIASRLRGANAKPVSDIFRRTTGKRPSRGIWLSFVLLLSTGLVVLYAASYYNAQDGGNALADVYSQMLGMAAGAVIMVFLWKIDYRILKIPQISGAFVAVSFIMLALVAIPGIGVYLNGSRRWLKLGKITFQPSELAKYSMVLFMARALSSDKRNIRNFFRGLIPLFIVPGVMFALVLLQPNLSTAGSIIIVSAIMTMLAGAKWLHLATIGVLGACVGTYYALSEPYRRARMMSFTDPFKYLSNEGYQLAQSLMAFGSGGLFGMGLGRGRQKFAFLPYPESDFIFAVVGEDLGLLGCIWVMSLFCALLFFGLRAAIRCPDRFGSLLAGGICMMIGVQTVLNIMVVVGMMPTTGLPLPFFSAGGTSVSIVMGAVGLLLNISSENDGL